MTQTAPRRSDAKFHKIKSEYATHSINRGLKRGQINEDDVNLLYEFIAEHKSCANISPARVNKLIYHLVAWRKYIGPFRENTVVNLYQGIDSLKSATNERGRPYKQNTLYDFVAILKLFYTWMIESDYTDINERKLKKIKPPSQETMTKEANDILSKEEVAAMIRCCQNSRDRAIITMLYEGGFRIGELGTLVWNDVKFDKYGVVVNVNFKTGKPRYIRLIMATEHISRWKDDYPFTPEPDALVFLTQQRNPLNHPAINSQIQKIAGRAGITKHVTPHIFRHTRITHLIQDGVNESVIKLMMWGTLTTNMFQTYAHLTGGDIDRAMLNNYGITTQEDEEQNAVSLEPRQCPNCHYVNGPVATYCSHCGQSLTTEAQETIQTLVQDLIDHPEILREVLEKRVQEKRGSQNHAPPLLST